MERRGRGYKALGARTHMVFGFWGQGSLIAQHSDRSETQVSVREEITRRTTLLSDVIFPTELALYQLHRYIHTDVQKQMDTTTSLP